MMGSTCSLSPSLPRLHASSSTPPSCSLRDRIALIHGGDIISLSRTHLVN
eukprot:m.431965 g.431965  ORF g.431965 m.431965 type:complete len:50 (+) comp86533_c0_seq1:181-330(+)